MQQQNVWHFAKYLLGIYNLKHVALFTNSMKKFMDIDNVGSV